MSKDDRGADPVKPDPDPGGPLAEHPHSAKQQGEPQTTGAEKPDDQRPSRPSADKAMLGSSASSADFYFPMTPPLRVPLPRPVYPSDAKLAHQSNSNATSPPARSLGLPLIVFFVVILVGTSMFLQHPIPAALAATMIALIIIGEGFRTDRGWVAKTLLQAAAFLLLIEAFLFLVVPSNRFGAW